MRLLNERLLFGFLALAGFCLSLFVYFSSQAKDQSLILEGTKDKLALIAYAAEDKLGGKTFNELLREASREHYPSDFQVDFLHKLVQPHAESLSTNGIGLFYFDVERDSILAYGPAALLKEKVPRNLPGGHSSLNTLETKLPSFQQEESIWRGNVYLYTQPLMREGHVYGLVGTSIPVDMVEVRLQASSNHHLAIAAISFVIWCLLLGILYFSRKFLYNRYHLRPWTEMIQTDHYSEANFLYGPENAPRVIRDFVEGIHNYQQISKKVMEHTSSCIVILNTQNQFLYINSKAEKLLGYTLADLNSLSTREQLLMFEPLPGHPRITNLLYGSLDVELVSEYLVTTKEQDKVPMQARAFSINFKGKVEGIVLALEDLREHHQFRRLQTQTTLLLESMNEGILILDEVGTIAYMNRAFEEILSTARTEWIGQSIFAANMQQELNANLELVLTGHSPREHANPVSFLNRPMEHLSLDILPFEDQAHDMKGALLIGRDETTEWQWRELSERTDLVESLSKMAASMAHEVRNPLTSIKGFLQLLSQSQPEPDKLSMYVTVMMQELERANSIITEYLSLTRSNLVQRKKVSILKLLDDIRILMESEAVIRGVNLHFYLTHTAVECDPTKIKQVMINLVRNALEATLRGGAVTVATDTDEESGYIQIQVSDTGGGIPKEALPHIFIPFYTTKKGGTGLGLPVCKQIIEEHGGTIQATSKEGAGSCFTVLLPLPQAKETNDPEAAVSQTIATV